MRIGPVLLAAALIATASCAHAEQTATAGPPPMPAMTEVYVANITTEENASAFCNAAAAERTVHVCLDGEHAGRASTDHLHFKL